MLWKVVRIDFTERCACIFGSKTHYITSGKGYVVADNEGCNERFSGPLIARAILIMLVIQRKSS